jgi:hypothetical protein
MPDDIELEPALRTEIDRLHARLDELDHYALLGVHRSADKKEVKSAYYGYAARIHPDRHFGKKLGPYKAKMEAIFNRVTSAHDTLASSSRRAEYDAYLSERDRLLELERALDVDTSLVGPAEERPVDPARVADSTDRMKAPSAPAALSPEAEKARREALARRLLGGSSRRMPAATAPIAKSSAPPPTPTPKQVGVDTLITSARGAATSGDLITASNRMRLAAKLDPRLNAEAEELTRRAHAAMADAYVKQARFEESEERWVAAAISWVKAHEGKSADPVIAERAANALRLAKGDLRKAVHLAELAARMRANDAACRLTLAECYLDAGLLKRARSELDVALRINAKDPRALALHQDLKSRGA